MATGPEGLFFWTLDLTWNQFDRMPRILRPTMPELVDAHLRVAIREDRWSGNLPGVARLALELDVSRHTVRHALRRLEAEGLLSGRGLGRSRGITA